MATNIEKLLGVQPVDTTHKRGSAIEALLAPEVDERDLGEFKKSLELEYKKPLAPEFVEQEYRRRHEPSPFEPVSDSPLPTKDFWGKVEELKDNPGQLVPFLSGGQEAVKYGKLLLAANRYKDGKENADDATLIRDYIAEQERDTTFGYNVLNTITYSIPFAVELGITGGIAGLGRAAIMKGGKEVLKQLITKQGKEVFFKKAAKWGVAKTTQTAVAGATRVWAGTQQKQLDSTINQIQTGEEKEDAITSLTKAFGEQWVETLSEFSGGLLTKPAQKILGNNVLKLALFNAFKKANPSMPVRILQQIAEKTGWNGIIGEMFEERVGAVGHRVMTSLGLGDQKPPLIPSAEQLAVEFVAFSVPGVGLAAANKLFEREQKVGPGGMTMQDVGPEIIDFTPPPPPPPPGAPPVAAITGEVAPEVEPTPVRRSQVNLEDVITIQTKDKFGNITQDETGKVIKIVKNKEGESLGGTKMRGKPAGEDIQYHLQTDKGIVRVNTNITQVINEQLSITKPGVPPVTPQISIETAPPVAKGVEEGIIQPPTPERPVEVKIEPLDIKFEDVVQTPLISAEEAFGKTPQDFSNRYAIALDEFETKFATPLQNKIDELTAQVKELRGPGSREQVKLLRKEIEDNKARIERGRELVEQNNFEFQLGLHNKMFQRLKERGFDIGDVKLPLKEFEDIGEVPEALQSFQQDFLDLISDERTMEASGTFGKKVSDILDEMLASERAQAELPKAKKETKPEKERRETLERQKEEIARRKAAGEKVGEEIFEEETEVERVEREAREKRAFMKKVTEGITEEEIEAEIEKGKRPKVKITRAEIVPTPEGGVEAIPKPVKKPGVMIIKTANIEELKIPADLVNEFWSNGEPLFINNDKYSVHKMSYGEFFLEPFGKERGEREGFAPGTLFLEKIEGEDFYKVNLEAEPEIKKEAVEGITPLRPAGRGATIVSDEQPTQKVEQPEDIDTGQGIRPGEVSGAVQTGAGQSGSIGESGEVVGGETVRGKPKGGRVGARDAGTGLAERPELTTGGLVKLSEAERLELNKQVEDIVDGKSLENRYNPDAYSKAEKETLRRYSGYGGIRERGEDTSGALDEYYTPLKLVRFAYQKLIDIVGADNLAKVQTIVEPAIGTGNFVYNSPFDDSKFVGFEINKYSAAVAKVLNPGLDLRLDENGWNPQNFSTQFFKNNKPGFRPEPYADLVVGNPPYGKYAGEVRGMGEGKEFATFEEYFIGRGLAITKPGGYLAYVVSSSFLRSEKTKGKEEIAKLGKLVGAYRFPNGVFADTQVGTDLVIFERAEGSAELTSNDKYFETLPEAIFGAETMKRGRFGMEKFVEGSIDDIPDANIKDFTAVKSKQTKTKKSLDEKLKEAGLEKVAILKPAPGKADFIIRTKNKGALQNISNEGVNSVELGAYEATLTDGSVTSDYMAKVSDEDKLRLFSYRKGRWYLDTIYVDNTNLYDLLADLDREREFLGKAQADKQERIITNVMPQWTTIEEIKTAPQSRFWEGIEADGMNIRHHFFTFLRGLPNQALEGIERYQIERFTNNNLILRDMSEEEKDFIQKNVARVANKLFGEFLKHSANNQEIKHAVENAFNRVLNSMASIDHRKVPVGTQIAQMFGGEELILNDAQRRAIGFLLVRGRGTAALDVGVGKTLTGVIATAEMFRRGTANRSMVLVPNDHIGQQWINTIREVLPESTIYDLRDVKNIPRVREYGIEKGSFVIITESGLDVLTMTNPSMEAILPNLREVFAGPQSTPREREQLIQYIRERFFGTVRAGGLVNFDELGLDHLTIDEIHNYYHVVERVPSREQTDSETGRRQRSNPYAALQVTQSKRAIRAFMFAKHVLRLSERRNVFGLSATPLLNSPLEIYTGSAFTGEEDMRDMGVMNVRDFVDTFMVMENALTVKPSLTVEPGMVVKRFVNFDAFRQFLNRNILKIDGEDAGVIRPKRIDKDYFVEPTQEQYDISVWLSERYVYIKDRLRELRGNDTRQAIEEKRALRKEKLQVQNDMVRNPLTHFATRRYQGPKPDYKMFVEQSPKFKQAAEVIKATYNAHKKANQIVFTALKDNDQLDINFINLFKEYLVKEVGIKADEIGIITGDTPKKQRPMIQKLFNEGKMRVIIGTAAIIEGLDLQAQTTDIHVLTPFWNYVHFRQLAGRGWRQNNIWKNIFINRYLTKNTGDIWVTQKIAQKELRDIQYNQALKRGERITETEGSELEWDELLQYMLTDPVQRTAVQKDLELQDTRSELAGLAVQLKRNQDLVNGVLTRRAQEDLSQAEEDIEYTTGRVNDLKLQLKEEMKQKGNDLEVQRVQARLETQQLSLNRAKAKKKRAEKEIKDVADFIEQEKITKQSVSDLEVKVKDLENRKETIDARYREREARALEERRVYRVQPTDYEAAIKKLREEHATFFEFEPTVIEKRKRQEEARKLREAEEKKAKRAPSGAATTLTLPIGAYDRFSEKIGEYESDAQAISQGLSEYPNFKLYEEVQALIQKYAKTVGQGYTPRGALGVFYTETENIRVNGMNDLSVASHEITHFLDKTYQIADKVMGIKGYSATGNPIYESESFKIRREMTDLYEKYYPGGKRKHKLKKRMTEGFATLLQKYAQAPKSITAEFPALVREFLKPGGKYYHPVMGEIIADLRAIIAEYQGLNELDKIGARIVDNEVNINKDDWLTMSDKIFEEMADEIYPAEKLAKMTGVHFTEQDPSLWLRIYNQVNQFIMQNINGEKGYWGWRNGKLEKLHNFNWRTLFDLLVSEKNTRDFNAFLVARNEHFLYQELEQLKELAELTSGDIKEDKERQTKLRNLERILQNDGFTKDEVDAAYAKNTERFKKETEMFDILTREDLNFLNDSRVQLLESDKKAQLLSREGYASMKRQFYDEITGEGELPQFVRVGKIRISSLIQRKGSQRPIISPLYSAIANHAEISKKGMRQIVYNRIAVIAPQAPALFQKLQLKVVPDREGKLLFPQEKDPNIVMARVNYKRVPILTDKTVKRVLDGVMSPQSISLLEKLIIGASRFFTKGTTGLFPAFAITNVLRDQLTAWGFTRNQFKPLYDPLNKLAKAFLESNSPQARYYLEYMIMGGDRMTFVTWMDMTPNELAIKLRNEQNGLEKVLNKINEGANWLAIPSKYSEIWTRATEYIKAREAGKSSIVAIEEAGRVSVPFHHIGRLGGGRFGKTFVKSVPFFNPGLQVLAQTYRQLDTIKSRKRMLFVFLAMTAAEVASFSLLAVGGDDEQKQQYKDLEARELADAIWLPNPAGKGLIRVPVPNIFTFLGAMINMTIAEGWLNADYDMRDYLAAGTSYLPQQFNITAPKEAFLALFPQIIKPATLAILNKQDFPRIRPLESQAQEAKTPGQRFTERTSKLAKALGGKLNISPIKIDFLLTGYAGRASQFATGKPGAFDLLKGVHRDYYFLGGRTLQNYYELEKKNKQQYHDYKNRLLKYPPEKVREIKKIRATINGINDMLDTYREIDLEKQPERASRLRERILKEIDTLNL